MEIVFIGDDFYSKSKTMMSSIYGISALGFYRTDWGKVSVALREGKSVHIRPATMDEMNKFTADLEHLLEGFKEQGL